MPIIANNYITPEYVNGYSVGNIYLGSTQVQGDLSYLFFNATGGNITYSGSYKIHTFTSSSTLSVINLGVSPSNSIEYLVVGGGGGAGRNRGGEGFNAMGGGGGAGGTARTGFITPLSSSYTVTIGLGGIGVGADFNTNPGGTSSFAGVIATGGESWLQGTSQAGKNADFNSGSAAVRFASRILGGGAGAGANGNNALFAGTPITASGGNGGDGIQSSINSTASYYGGGGGAAASTGFPANVQGTGGLGGGGNAGDSPQNGTANTGGGGGGANSVNGGDGGTGVVIIKYQYRI